MSARGWLRLIGSFKRHFREGKGIVAPVLIAVWLPAAVASIGMSVHMAVPGISSYRGSVADLSRESGDGLRIFLRGSRYDFFFSDIDYSPLPDVKVGDDVQILAEDGGIRVDDKAGRPVIWGLALESRRGEWTDQVYGDEVTPFTPSWWPLHEAIQWLLVSFGLCSGVLGVASLLRWIPSRSSVLAAAPALATPLPGGERSADAVAITAGPVSAARGLSRAAIAGLLTVSVPAALDLVVIVVGGANACHENNPVLGWGFIVLILAPIVLAAGGVTTLVLASHASRLYDTPPAAARSLGVIALVMAVIAVPVNFFAAASWVLCF